ncbi:MAG TPA: CocE/NonD family hydrolase C-terminal non-catalytic domain-containing protein [Acidobacteriota bacterium]|nr:CocE/NonD family hydrolase C-terminal non-catalytic domain-containing protein [Acidobacteriota bacterium]
MPRWAYAWPGGRCVFPFRVDCGHRFRLGSEAHRCLPGRRARQRHPIAIDLRDRYHTFKAGHRIMVQVQSSWFPAYDRNPQTFVDIYHARANDYQVATQAVFRTPEHPSHLILGVIE